MGKSPISYRDRSHSHNSSLTPWLKSTFRVDEGSEMMGLAAEPSAVPVSSVGLVSLVGGFRTFASCYLEGILSSLESTI